MMAVRLDVIGLVVEDMARSLAFYRRLGLEASAEAEREPHVEVSLPGGLRLAFDTEETIRSFDPDWTPPSGVDRMRLAFLLETPAEVDQVYAELTTLGYEGTRSRGMRSGVSAMPSSSTPTASASPYLLLTAHTNGRQWM